jgi:predicted nuclease of restriction endonuclease-like (RecB) superfamily
MRLAYLTYPICEELPHKLTWTHICELVKISDPLERKFYQMQAMKEKWSTTELIQKSYQIFCHQISYLKIDLSAFITNQKLNESFFH